MLTISLIKIEKNSNFFDCFFFLVSLLYIIQKITQPLRIFDEKTQGKNSGGAAGEVFAKNTATAAHIPLRGAAAGKVSCGGLLRGAMAELLPDDVLKNNGGRVVLNEVANFFNV